MTVADRWLLPDGIDEVLPPAAMQIEQLRRQLLDLYHCWGYDLVIPPHLEYLESLQAGAGHDLDLQTFKIIDQLTGRLLGLRADTTPSVARMDAHTLKREGPVRLCYAGSVFHTKPCSLAASRSPIQVGAELYGHSGIASDVEVISLLLETLNSLNIQNVYLDMGHVGIFRGLVAQAQLSEERQQELFDILQRKDATELTSFVANYVDDVDVANMLLALPELAGDFDALNQARKVLSNANENVHNAIRTLEQVGLAIHQFSPSLSIYFDLCELRGYNYHTGILFAAYVPGQGQAVAQGGRYDGIGKVFGRSRPATGFSSDLKVLLDLITPVEPADNAIWAPIDVTLEVIQALRAQGERVIRELPDQIQQPKEMGCNRTMQLIDGNWQVVAL
ncbi:ATP phosphoribosyltransferase regulatory subunit [Spartinivicinus ruber]|uniref:ATP phosphoribosyltransferase regulatory subunit n=1 Tax=Spartinivicinus ruber TaxID=2683272 RepID=UPI0013D26A88|nr:ATP phosphoribosyltransferase regulatory subunit [Spartinivicinus ruber]